MEPKKKSVKENTAMAPRTTIVTMTVGGSAAAWLDFIEFSSLAVRLTEARARSGLPLTTYGANIRHATLGAGCSENYTRVPMLEEWKNFSSIG
jgi:hypothetical protein